MGPQPCLLWAPLPLLQVRMESLGSDRRYNRYWRFVLADSPEAAARKEGQVSRLGLGL